MKRLKKESRPSRAITRAVRHVRGFSHRDTLIRLRDNFLFSPRVIYDIGAHQGKWSTEVSALFPNAKIFMFEANPANEQNLVGSASSYVIAALSDQDGQKRQFFTPKTGSNTGSSLYKAQNVDFRDDNLEILFVETRRLDSLVKDKMLPRPDFMKLDVQGSELEVLRGAGDLLSDCRGIIAELSFVQGNEGAPQAGAVLSGIEALGFGCVDLCKARRTVIGSVCEVDLLFVNKELYGKYLDLQLGRDFTPAPQQIEA